MKWFRKRSGPPPGAAAVMPRGEAAGESWESHPSLALTDLFTHRPFGGSRSDSAPERQLHVIDLGSAQGANISFLAGRFPCSVEVVDLVGSLPALGGEDPEKVMADAIPASGEPADLVLAWDVLNYLSKEQFRAAGARLAERCRPGALVFAMIVTAPAMAPRPGTYLLREAPLTSPSGVVTRDGIELVYRHLPTPSPGDPPPATRPSPRFRPAEVDAMFPGFSVHRSMLLRHGVQEFLMARDEVAATGDAQRPVAATGG